MIGIGLLMGWAIFRASPNSKVTDSNSTIVPSSSMTLTTSNSSTLPTATARTTTLPVVTTTSIHPALCPPVLLKANHVNNLLSLDNTIIMTDFNHYSLEYTSPVNTTTAMLMFEFTTVWGSWYLDDVSVKESGSTNQELIDNGGFETGNLSPKWKFCDERYSWIIDGSVVDHTSHSGRYSYESQNLDVGSQEYLTQIFDIKSNTKYTIDFFIFYNGASTSAKVTIISN